MKPAFLPRIGLCVTIGIVLCLTLLSANRATGQQATAQLMGTVKDSSGAVVASAKVSLRNSGTNTVRTTTTSKGGEYVFTLIPIGAYELTVEQQGFEKYLRRGITLEINQNARLDVSLQVGATNQVVEVQGDVAQVDTVSATLGKVETTQRILQLPLVERDTLQLGLLQAGVFAPDQDDGSGNPFSVSGQRSESMTFLLDGADNNDFLGNNYVVDPNPDAVAEFKILTNNYTAEYGRTSGGIINQVIKSGTNSVHGSAFEFFRNTALDASDYFLGSVPILRRNLFGGTIGFPIKKDKLFFFASYQGTRRAEGQNPGPLPVLDQAERAGNFSELYTGITNPITGYDTGQLFDPTTGGSQPFMCNGTPCNQVTVDPVIANYIKNYLPLPNLPGNEFVADPVASIKDDQFIFRLDYNLSKKDTLSAVYIFDDTPDTYPFQIINGASTGGDVPIGSGFTDANRYQSGNITWTRTISPTMLNELRFAANRSATYDYVPTTTTSPSALGFLTVTPDDPKGTAPPLMTVTGNFNVGPSPQGPTKIHDTTFQYQDTLSWTKGRHDLKFGADLRWVENNFNFDFYNNGSFTFGQGGSFTGNTMADFVGGFFDNYYQFSNAVYGIRTHSLYFFGQDAWKVTHKLTLSYGLRYEYNSPQEDPHNEIIGWYPGQQSTKFPMAPPNFLYPGDPGTPNRGLIYPDRNNFAPRFGFAWDMMGNAKLVMRGGIGIFYDIEDGALNLQFGGQPPFGYVANNFPCYNGGNANGCLSPQGGSFVADPFQTAATGYSDPYPFVAGGHFGQFFTPALPFAYVVYPHFRTPYAENFNYGFQYQLTKDTMIEAVYVGSISRKAISGTELNYATLGGPSGLVAQYNYFLSQEPTTGVSTTSAINVDCARPLAACSGAAAGAPSFTGSPTGATQIYTSLSEGNSSSNEFQLTVDKRLSHGLQFRAAYTLAKTIDEQSGFRARSSTFSNPADPGADRGLADFDATHRLVVSPIWQVPLGNHGSRFTQEALGGWTVATIASFQSGNPFTLFSENNSSELNNYLDRPDVVGPIQIYHNPRQVQTLGGDCGGGSLGHYYFNPADFECAVASPVGLTPDPLLTPGAVPLFTHGNMGRNVLRGPGINNWDISISKDFKFTESKSLEFRSEFFNAFNHVQFYSPTLQDGTVGGDSLFGQITSDRGPRVIQFALKLYF
jgi:Carboxypeptidase regulatory-like domain